MRSQVDTLLNQSQLAGAEDSRSCARPRVEHPAGIGVNTNVGSMQGSSKAVPGWVATCDSSSCLTHSVQSRKRQNQLGLTSVDLPHADREDTQMSYTKQAARQASVLRGAAAKTCCSLMTVRLMKIYDMHSLHLLHAAMYTPGGSISMYSQVKILILQGYTWQRFGIWAC